MRSSVSSWPRATRGRKVIEATVEEHLRTQVQALGGLCVKIRTPERKGMPDRLVILPGRPAFFVELKRPGARPRAEQIRRMAEIQALGTRAYWVDSKAAVDKLLSQVLHG